MAIQREIWQDHIVGNLFKNNEFLLASTDASQFVLQGKVVHIPQAGILPNVVKNRSALPAAVTTRADADITYTLDEYTSDPILIPNADSAELSYNKRDSILAEHESALRQSIADTLLFKWAEACTVVNTSGATAPAHLDGATGNRGKLTLADLKQAQLQMNRANIPIDHRYALLSADMLMQLSDAMDVTQYRDFSAAYNAQEGIIGRLYGFNIMSRSSVVSFAGETNIKAQGTAAAATDCDAVLCWHKDAVERALGEVKFYECNDDPTYYGNVYSMSVRMGGRRRRADNKGVLAIVQKIIA